MVMGLVSGLSLANHSDSVLSGGAHLVQPRWMPERRILGGGRTCGVSFWPFPNSSGWWRLICSLFLPRTFCHKTAHADGYCAARPGGRFQSLRFPQGWAYCDTRCSQRNAVFLHLESYIIKGVFLNFKNIKFENIQNRKKLLPWYLLAKTKKKIHHPVSFSLLLLRPPAAFPCFFSPLFISPQFTKLKTKQKRTTFIVKI